jgi:hypothetical protein
LIAEMSEERKTDDVASIAEDAQLAPLRILSPRRQTTGEGGHEDNDDETDDKTTDDRRIPVVLLLSTTWWDKWTAEEVGRWLTEVLEIKDVAIAQQFTANDVRGFRLPALNNDILKNDFGIKSVGVRLKILTEIANLPKLLAYYATREENKPKKLHVEIGYKVENVGEIDCLRSVFFCHFKLFARWTDRRVEVDACNCLLLRTITISIHAPPFHLFQLHPNAPGTLGRASELPKHRIW